MLKDDLSQGLSGELVAVEVKIENSGYLYRLALVCSQICCLAVGKKIVVFEGAFFIFIWSAACFQVFRQVGIFEGHLSSFLGGIRQFFGWFAVSILKAFL